MPRLYSSAHIIKVLELKGFAFVSQKGSHIKLHNRIRKLTVIVPANKKEIPLGTMSSILRQSGLNKEDFK
jgi:predicted RNA binding protein YcfA (HicA-like mRNA interferase family)